MADDSKQRSSRRGPVAWMARNHVAANLLMLVFLVGGALFSTAVVQEVFPEVELDMITVTTVYRGASPEEVEEGVILAVEEAVRGIDGVKEVRSLAREGSGTVIAELFSRADADQALNDIKSAVDRITSFPEDAERPVISLLTNRREVLSIVVHGPDLDRDRLDRLSEEIRRELLQRPGITLVEVAGIPEPEISIEVSQEALRRYGLTLGQIAAAVGRASVDIPGGELETGRGEVLLRTTERRERGEEFADIAVLSRPDGVEVPLGRLATIEDRYRDVDVGVWYQGEPAVRVRVFRVGDQKPLDIAEEVKRYLEEKRAALPQRVDLTVIDDSSETYENRVGLLLENARLGAVLVLIILGLFLHPRLAFWVTLGIPISFLGAFLFLPALDVSINMISLFAFLLVLGIVVDDAIVVGEATFRRRSEGADPTEAAIAGTREVLRPVLFAVTTTIIAFVPMLFIPGVGGKFFRNIPLIVIPILVLSLIESLLILPAHLAGLPEGLEQRRSRWFGWFQRFQQRFSGWIERQIDDRYGPLIRTIARQRWLTLACGLALLLIAAGAVVGGHIEFNFMPQIEGETVTASVELPFGAPFHETRAAVDRLADKARTIAEESGGDREASPIEGVLVEVGRAPRSGDATDATARAAGSHLGYVDVYLTPAGERELAASTFMQRWRESAKDDLPGVERSAFRYSDGPTAGAAVAIELSHDDLDRLEAAARDLARTLDDYAAVYDIDEGFDVGKPQLDLELRPAARALGVTESDLGLQVRAAFFGAEAVRQQRGRDELRVYVRRPERERDSLWAVENFVVRTPEGGEIPLAQAARIEVGRSFTEIERKNGRRVVEVSADVDTARTSGGQVLDDLRAAALPRLVDEYPGLSWEVAGEQEEQRETLRALGRNMAVALFVMYAVMAVAFHSYAQPLLILLAIPFGLISAVAGHLLMGFDLSLISLLGLVALAGVVVNDALVLVVAINDFRRDGRDAEEAVVRGSKRRFRPVLLTSLTTFFGLAPMIFETSLQARFLIPMALSLGFGVLFVTVIVLALVPAGYLALEDARSVLGSLRAGVRRRLASASAG